MKGKKGFQRPGKALTKGQMVQQQSSQIDHLKGQSEQNSRMIQSIQQFMFQTNQQFAQHLQQLQRQVDELSNLVRLKQSSEVTKLDDWVVVDLMAFEFAEDGESVLPEYMRSLTTLGTSFRLEKDQTFFPVMVENLLGKKAGDCITLDCVIPDTYPAKELHNKKVRMDITLINVYSPVETNTRLGEVKTKIDAKIAARKQKEAEEKAAAEKAKVKAPDEVKKAEEAKIEGK